MYHSLPMHSRSHSDHCINLHILPGDESLPCACIKPHWQLQLQLQH